MNKTNTESTDRATETHALYMLNVILYKKGKKIRLNSHTLHSTEVIRQ